MASAGTRERSCGAPRPTAGWWAWTATATRSPPPAPRFFEFGDRVTLVQAPFSQVEDALTRVGAVPVDGFLVDLGVSSPQLDRPERGFSFRESGPLDMRMDQSQGETAGDLLRRVDEEELATIIRDYGEERYARRITRAIIEARERGELDSTGALGAIVARAMPRHEWQKNPATRTFQALRIAVNQELAQIEPAARIQPHQPTACARAGNCASSRFTRSKTGSPSAGCAVWRAATAAALTPRRRLLNKHVIVAGDEERERNPRARSAKLRAAERI